MIRRAQQAWRRFLADRAHQMFRDERAALLEIISVQQDQLFEAEENHERLKDAIKEIVREGGEDTRAALWRIGNVVEAS